MLKSRQTKTQKALLMAVTLIFVLSSFCSILFFKIDKAQAEISVPEAPTDVIPDGQSPESAFASNYAAPPPGGYPVIDYPSAMDRAMAKIGDEVKAVFFKNILGTFLNIVAQQSAVWVSTGGQGKAPQFIRNFDKFINGFANGVMVDAAVTIIQNLTGINICTLDPRITIDLVKQIPGFPEYVKPTPACTWKQLVGHWEEIGATQFITFNYSLSAGGDWGSSAEKMKDAVTQNDSLQVWDKLLKSYVVGCNAYTDINDVKTKCNYPTGSIKYELDSQITQLNTSTTELANDVKLMLDYALSDTPAPLAVGNFKIVSENINAIKQNWLDYLLGFSQPVSDLNKIWGQCQNLSALEMATPNATEKQKACLEVLGQLGITVPTTADLNNNKTLKTVWEQEVNAKISYVISILQATNSGYSYLTDQINSKFNPDYFEGSLAYTEELAKDLFKPEANQFNAYDEIMKEIMKQGLNAYLNRQVTAVVDNGWEAATGKIYDIIETPADLIRSKATKDLTANDSAAVYTKSVVADAVGVFMHTLWNIMVQKFLDMLYPAVGEESAKQLEQRVKVTDLPITDDVYTPALPAIIGIGDYIQKISQQYSFNFTLKNLDLMTDFQLFLSGEVKPNIYNNVADSGLALAINDKQTIKEALDKGRLQGNFGFSFGETADPSTYNLANIKKLRKARVAPLGLELAAELIRDCTYRKNSQYADFNDLTATAPYGYSNNNDQYNVQRLQNCLFKPYIAGEDIQSTRDYNKNKLNQAVGATLSDVVNGFSQSGSGVCGDFDESESPFCNLVDPNWVLKLPPTKCAEQTDSEPYGELLKTNEGGQRYSRCTDFASCLQEDGKGGCVNEQYGFCAKEANAWQFGVTDCPAEFNSCTTYTLPNAENTAVSYLKNTLSGNDICGPDNAGCQWYSTNSSAGDVWHDYVAFTDSYSCTSAGGAWLGDHCQADRIYLNNYAQTCDQSNASCNEFSLVRDPANNLAGDSGFEYTIAGALPQNWDVILKKEMIQSDCQAQKGTFDKTCLNYDYETEILCADNNGQWFTGGVCTDSTYPSESECATNGAKWVNCLGAINKTATPSDCALKQGDYKEYCQLDLLKYNLCQEPQFATETECSDNGGAWVEECEINPAPAAPFTDKTNCETAKGSWKVSCQGAKVYNSNPVQCRASLGQWQGYGPFTDLAYVTKDGLDTYEGAAKLQVNVGQLYSDEELLLKYTLKLPDATKDFTRPGDVYTASAYIKSKDILLSPIGEEIPFNFSLVKTNLANLEANTTNYYPSVSYGQAASSLVTNTSGKELQIVISLPGGQRVDNVVYIDAVNLNLNSINQIRNYDLVSSYNDSQSNNKVYYKKPPLARLNCHGYGPGDPPPVLDTLTTKIACEAGGGYWDQPTSGQGLFVAAKTGICYQYGPDDSDCANYLKVCEPEEAGCQIYTPVNGDPAIPGVVSITDYCPAECVGYQSYKQEPVFYDPEPDPLFNNFIAETAQVCSYADVGCSQFTNLDEIAKGGEGIEYYSYLKQCIKPNLGLGEKNFFTWQSSAGGPPQIVKYQFESDSATGAPKTIDGTGDCLAALGADDFNCLKFIDSNGREYYRDIRKTISVSDNCHPYRKTDSTQAVCSATNGRWQADSSACLYDAIPGEGLACSAEANGCREFIGNRGNNVYVQIFDNFENTKGNLDWFSGAEGTSSSSLIRSSESVVLGGHSLQFAPDPVNNVSSMHKPVDLQKGSLYTLSFWAKSDSNNEVVTAFFSTADINAENSAFATDDNKNIVLNNQWKNYNLGPVYISWDNLAGNNLIFGSINSKSYFDNIILKVITDNVYAVKNSWNTPASCDLNIYGLPDINNPHPMLGCQAYTDTAGQTHNLKSFTNLCRASSVGCQLLIDTKNSASPNLQQFNDQNNTTLDDYQVPADELMTLVLNNSYSCGQEDKGCQKLGQPSYSGQALTFSDVYLKNNPDKYTGVAGAIMCNDEALGCTELVNDTGSSEYYKIESNKLCEYGQKTIFGQNITGWFKKGSAANQGCAALPYENVSECTANGGLWSATYNQCTLEYEFINDEIYCLSKGGVWEGTGLSSKCLASPFAIYKNFQAAKYQGYVGLCDSQNAGCTEFVDINPNYVFNGSFESADEYKNFSNWTAVLDASAGAQNIESTDVKIGNSAAKLIKRTSQACPSTYNNLNSGCVLSGAGVPNFGLKQTISRLAKGKTYKISFYYRTPLEAKGLGENCTWPEAAFSFEPIISNSVEKRVIHTYDPQKDWKKVDALYTVPLGVCSDATKFTKTECVSPAKWTEYEDLQDFELALYAPLSQNPYNSNIEVTPAGNCPESYILYDQVEVKDNTEDSYYVIDNGPNLDRSTCTAVNWDLGCVQFLNTLTDNYEMIKVKKDRNCAEWAICSSYCSDPQYTSESDCTANAKIWNPNLCTATNLCAKEENNVCQQIAPGKDNVRYDLSNQPLVVKRVSNYDDKSGYLYRYGSGALSTLVQWRAGDYSGYTIPDRYPLEKEVSNNFSAYEQDNNLGSQAQDKRYAEPICKVFPAEDSPLPYQLSKESNYKNLKNLYSQSARLQDIGNSCSYEVASAASYTTYFPHNFVKTSQNLNGGIQKICTSPLDMLGKSCTGATATEEINLCSGTGGTPVCQAIEKVNEFIGQEGMCLESDILNPLYDTIYSNLYGADKQYQPYACLTYYPFAIDLCPFHKEATGCKANPDCEWISPSACQRKQAVSAAP